ncbi:MAG: O-antigen polymerase [Bryobacteraceae bacterium]
MTRKEAVWWLSPGWIFCGLSLLVTIAAAIVPDSLYRYLWRTPKYFGLEAMVMIAGSIVLFGLGYLTPNARPSGWVHANTAVEPPLHLKTLLLLYRISFYLCIIGYSVWAAVALKRGLNVGVLVALISGQHGISETLRLKYLENIPGLTSFTQFGIASAVLGALIIRAGNWRRIRFSIVALFFCAVVRTMLNSERLAVIETVVPFATILVQFLIAPKCNTRRLRRSLNAFPVVAAGGLYFVFSFFEYFRSWVTYYAGGAYSFWAFEGCRLAGYYVTALNNGAFFLHRLDTPLNVPYFVLSFLWRFPVLNQVTDTILGTPVNVDDYFKMLYRGANAEFNNGDGLLVPYIDFGVAGGLLYWFSIGLLSAVLYRSFKSARAWGLCLYPVLFLGLSDVSRCLYWSSGRAVPGMVFLLVSGLFLHMRQKRAPSTRRAHEAAVTASQSPRRDISASVLNEI